MRHIYQKLQKNLEFVFFELFLFFFDEMYFDGNVYLTKGQSGQ